MRPELKAVGDSVIASVKQIVSRVNDALAARIDDLDTRLKALPMPRDGKDGAPGLNGKDGANGRNGIDGKDGADGKSVEPAEVLKMVVDTVAALPKPRDGVDGKNADPELVRAEVAKAVAALPVPKDGSDGKDGTSVKPEDVAPMLEQMVSKESGRDLERLALALSECFAKGDPLRV